MIVSFAISKAFVWNEFKFITHLFLPHQRGSVVFACIFYYLLSTAFKLYDYWQESEVRKIKLTQEVIETELLYLKSQMSPHFLFNTLNNIYGLSLTNNNQTSLSISQLKDLMIYVEKFELEQSIAIEEEVNYLKSFIALNKLRYGVNVNFQYSKSNKSRNIVIEPMILLPFIENAFKHGDTEEKNSINISLIANTNAIQFTIDNSFGIKKRKDDIGGIGIKNVERRLEILYPKSHVLKIAIEHSLFTVSLKLTHHE